MGPVRYSVNDWESRNFRFGDVSFPLDFGVFAPRKYVRVPWNTSEEELLRFITQIWSPPQPVVIVSLITGINSDSEWNNGKRTMVAFRSAIKNAAISTDMWLITHGLHLGPTKTVGLTYKGELEARTAKNARERSKREPNLPLVLIGISPVSIIRNSDRFIGGHVDYGLSDRSDYRSQAKYLDPNHTHYILIDDSDMRTPQELSLRTRIEYKLMEYKRFACPSEDTSEGLTDEETMTTSPAPSKDEIPIVCLLIGGAQSSVRAINERFLIEVPILICKGTGFLADSISFAADMIRKKGSTNQKVAKSLKSDLVKRVLRQGYSPPVDLEVNTIISIAKVHGESASGRVSIVDIREWEMDAGLLHRELLQLLLHFHRSQRQEGDHLNFLEGTKQELKLKEMCRRLQLLMDWNEPELAKSEIFEQDDFPKNSIPISIFEQAVVRRNREPFVELFLDRNFCLQKYFTQKRIRRLIVLSAPDFFNEVCMSGILGRKDARLIGPSDDISLLINSIIQKLTGFHDTFQLADFMTQLDEIKCVRFLASEKQSFISMTLLSVLLNRHQLAKVLIRRSSYPIPLAIFCSLIYKRLRHYCFFWHRRNELKDQAKEMADFAKGILGLYYDGLESKAPGKHILEHVNPEFGHVTTLQLAFKAELMDFMAHPCCQQYITSEYYGGLQFRNVRFGICRMPESLKAILCAYLLIPCRWWISFTEDDIVDEGSANPEAKQSGSSTKNPQTNDQKNEQPPHFVVEMPEIHSSGSFYLECAKRTWESPMIKFHLQYFNYILFLILLAFCCIMPACGRFDIDTLAWLWCLTITVELALTTFKNYMKSNHFPLKWNCVDCGIQVVFLLLFLFLRLGPWSFANFGYMNPKTGRMVICFGMVYFTYRIPFVYMSVSRTLGPQIVWIKYTLSHDFADFMKLAMVIMFAGAITINAMVYPYWPNNEQLYEKAFLRSFFALFLTEKGDIETAGTGQCSAHVPSFPVSKQYCYRQMQSESKSYPKDPWMNQSTYSNDIDYECAESNSFAWLLLVQYLVLVKLFLLTILYAMFNNSWASISEYSSLVWMFKRYENVMSIKNASPLPPPFNVFYHLFKVLTTYCKVACKRLKSKIGGGNESTNVGNGSSVKIPSLVETLLSSEDLDLSGEDGLREFLNEPIRARCEKMYWRILSQQYGVKNEQSDAFGKLRSVEGILTSQGVQMKHLFDKVNALQQNLSSIQTSIDSRTRSVTAGHECAVGSSNAKSPTIPALTIDGKVHGHRYYDPIKLERQINWNGMDHIQTACCGPLLIDRRSWVFRQAGVRVTYAVENNMPICPFLSTDRAGRGVFALYGPNHEVVLLILSNLGSSGSTFVVANRHAASPENLIPRLNVYDGYSKRIQLVLRLFRQVVAPKSSADDPASSYVDDKFFASRPTLLFGMFMNTSQCPATRNAWLEHEYWYVDVSDQIGSVDLDMNRFEWVPGETIVDRMGLPNRFNELLCN